jgi:hypothetical protein
MAGKKKVLLPVLVSCAALFALAAALAWPGYSQGVAQTAKQQLTPDGSAPETTKKTLQPLPAAAASETAWTVAARQNAQLRAQLPWVFGGKAQRGWALYAPLIAHTLDTEAEADTGDFAHALASWQRGAGLAPSGTLDDETLYQFIAQWQARRLKERAYPTPDQLVTAPPAEFYAPERPAELRQVERTAYAAYKRMLAAAIADPAAGLKTTPTGELAPEEKFLKIVSAFRSKEYQAQLRRQDPSAGRAQLAVNSPHFTGRALDLYVGGEPVSTKDANRALQTQTPAYRWLVKNAARFGFQPYYYEPWHWEYVGQ